MWPFKKHTYITCDCGRTWCVDCGDYLDEDNPDNIIGDTLADFTVNQERVVIPWRTRGLPS